MAVCGRSRSFPSRRPTSVCERNTVEKGGIAKTENFCQLAFFRQMPCRSHLSLSQGIDMGRSRLSSLPPYPKSVSSPNRLKFLRALLKPTVFNSGRKIGDVSRFRGIAEGVIVKPGFRRFNQAAARSIGTHLLVCRLLYGSGMRILEALRFRANIGTRHPQKRT